MRLSAGTPRAASTAAGSRADSATAGSLVTDSRKWPSVTKVKTDRATALPIEAIADRSNRAIITTIATPVESSPNEIRPPSRRAMIGGNCPVSTRWSDTPTAG